MSKKIKIEQLLNDGYILFKQQKFLESIKKYKKALLLDTTYSKTLFLLGLSYGSINNSLEAKRYFTRSLVNDHNNFYIHYNLAKALSELSLDNESIDHHKKAIKINSKHPGAWLNYGISLKKLNNYVLAKDCIRKSIIINPNESIAFSHLGEVLIELDDFEGAIICFTKSLKIKPGSAEIITNLGVAYKNKNDFNKAIELHLSAIAINSNYAEAYSNLGITYRGLFNYKDALINLNIAIKLNSNLESAWINKGLILADTNNYLEAKNCYEQTIKINKNNSEAYLNLSLLELSNRNFSNGWKYYEKRWHTKKFQKYITSSKPKWNGKEKINSILIVSEQGLGDQILYSSMFDEINKYSDNITLLSDPKLVSLFKRSFPNFKVISRSDFNNDISVENYDTHIAMATLGGCFRNNISDFNKSKIPFILDDKNLTLKIKTKIKDNDKLICGISWHSKNQNIGANKSIDLNTLKPIFNNKKIKFVNLQYGNVNEIINNFNNTIENKIFSVPEVDLTNDIDGSISIIKNCDFILTISNTTAHLAGSVNKDVLLLAPKNVGKLHYWSSETDRSLWYPSVKIFKQNEDYSWEKTIKKINRYIEDQYINLRYKK